MHELGVEDYESLYLSPTMGLSMYGATVDGDIGSNGWSIMWGLDEEVWFVPYGPTVGAVRFSPLFVACFSISLGTIGICFCCIFGSCIL